MIKLFNAINKLLSLLSLKIIKVKRTNHNTSKDKQKQKIFGIGFNKTGTTTLEKVLVDLGYNIPDQASQELLLTHDVENGRFHNFKEFLNDYDFFQDRPFSQNHTYIACDLLFPNSKFILTIRDEDEWFKSIYNFHKKIFGFTDKSEISESFFKGKNLYLEKDYTWRTKRKFALKVLGDKVLEDWNLLYDEEHYKKIYRNRNEEIMKYFYERPSDLLVIDLTKEKDTKRIVEFLEIGKEKVKLMPHQNKT